MERGARAYLDRAKANAEEKLQRKYWGTSHIKIWQELMNFFVNNLSRQIFNMKESTCGISSIKKHAMNTSEFLGDPKRLKEAKTEFLWFYNFPMLERNRSTLILNSFIVPSQCTFSGQNESSVQLFCKWVSCQDPWEHFHDVCLCSGF